MVKTRDLGRTLGKVIGRALGREVSCDADDAPSSEGPQHPHVDNEKLNMLLRMFMIWIT